MKRYAIIFLVLLLICTIVFSERREEYLVMDEEGRYVMLTIYYPRFSEFSNKIRLKSSDYDVVKLFKNKYALNIWKFDVGRLNDENRCDIVFGVYNEAPHHKVMAKRMFAYKIVDGDLLPKFRCSRFITPMIDFNLYDMDGDGYDEVVTLEEYKGVQSLNIYRQYDLKIERVYNLVLDDKYDSIIKGDGIFVVSENNKREFILKDGEVFLK